MSKVKYHDYIIEHRGKSSIGYSALYNIVGQDHIPSKVKVKNLFPTYITGPNLLKARNKYINSFIFPRSKSEWQYLYNLSVVRHGRNFWAGSEQTGTKGVALRDRRYKKGYRTEYHGKYQTFHKQHPYTPWSRLTDRTVNILQSEFFNIIDRIKKKQRIGRILIPLFLILTTLGFMLFFPLLGFVLSGFLLLYLSKYFVNHSSIESSSFELANRIAESYETQEEDAKQRYLDYDLIDYGFLQL